MAIDEILKGQVTPASGCVIVIFGASGDLARKKLYPSLYQLYVDKLLPKQFHIVGYSRTKMTQEKFRENLSSAYKYKDTSFFSKISYVNGPSYSDEKALLQLNKVFNKVSQNRIYYLSLPPTEFRNVCTGLKKAKLLTQNSGSEDNQHTLIGEQPFTRIVFEKPFGVSYSSARKLHKFISNHFKQDQIFLIDHYLGKEPIQNILYFRFANSIFENLWNGRYIDHMQITLNEDITVDKRAGYFDNSGTLRDMIQTHALQVLALACMEPPSSFTANNIRTEKAKLLESLRAFSPAEVMSNVVRGQYDGYLQEQGVAENSMTETLVAFKVNIHNWRWSGMPVYVRTGKALREKCTELVVHFKETPYNMFGETNEMFSNRLIFRFQPDTFVKLHMQTKVPGNTEDMIGTDMNFTYATKFKDINYSNGYDRILHSAVINDSRLFLSPPELLAQWYFTDAIIEEWDRNSNIPPACIYTKI